MDQREKVLEMLSKVDIPEESDYEAFIEKIKGKDSEKIIEELVSQTPSEIGGRIALTGFYYQFLVFLEYWTQMLNGQWDFVALELHEDIVVGKDNKLRFTQVKSSKETELHASGTIKVRSKIKEGNRVKAVVNDSWIDKLITKAKYFKKTDGYETEFELVSSFVILNSTGMNITKYKSKEFPKNVEENDDLVKFLKEDLHDRDENRILYEDDCGERISELLTRFKITKRPDLDEINYYEDHILMRISHHLGVGANLTDEDLYMLVGRLMKMCYLYENKLMLYISDVESRELIQSLDDRANERAEKRAQVKGSITIIDEVFSNLTQQLSSMDLFQDVNVYILSYKKYLLEWIEQGGTLRELINRYLDGDQYSSVFNLEHKDLQKNRLFEFFTVNLLIILAYEEITKFSMEYKSLLVKEIQSKYVGFLSLNRGDQIEKGIEKAKNILKNHEDFKLLLNPPNIILQGNFINNRSKPIQQELLEDDLELSQLPKDIKLDEVNLVLNVIPGGIFDNEFNNLYTFKEIEELKGHLNVLWGGLF